MIGNTLFRCWGWNNEVNVFDTRTAAWSVPEIRVGTTGPPPSGDLQTLKKCQTVLQGPLPTPRGCHASAVLGNKGYIAGGVVSRPDPEKNLPSVQI